MKNLTPIIIFISLFLIQCNSSTESEVNLNFAELEIHYSKYGGWINSSILDIYGNGTVNAYEVNQGMDTLKSSSKILDENAQNTIAHLFSPFSTYKSNYYPEKYMTDQNFNTIIYKYKGEVYTVSVYMAQETDMPYGLRKIIQDMENRFNEIIELDN